jgi:hypothetical protein
MTFLIEYYFMKQANINLQTKAFPLSALLRLPYGDRALISMM